MNQPKSFIHARSRVVDIRDGDDLQKGIWNISPELKPDVFTAERFRGTKKITFYTDLDSIAYDVVPERTYKFAIILNGTDTAWTVISTRKEPGLVANHNSTRPASANDTIPFVMAWNNHIMVRGKINNSEWLDMIFDTGANGISLSDDALKKDVKITVSGSTTSYGMGGAQQDQVSENNTMEIGGLKWKGVKVIVKSSGKPPADVVLGYNAFEGKIVEINYDHQILVIHNSIPQIEQGYTRYDLKFKRGLAYVNLVLFNGIKKTEGTFIFDTGSSEALFLSQAFSASNDLYKSMKITGHDRLKGSGPNKIDVVKMKLSGLVFGNYSLEDVPIKVETASSVNGPAFNILGNDVLKRFNVIIDYQKDCIYFKPNMLTSSLYLSEKVTYLKVGIGVVLLSGLVAFCMIYYRKKKKARDH